MLLIKINENSLAINIFKKMYIEDGYFISLIIRKLFAKKKKNNKEKENNDDE